MINISDWHRLLAYDYSLVTKFFLWIKTNVYNGCQKLYEGILIHSLWMCWVVNFGGDITERMAYASQLHTVNVLFSFFNPQIDNYMYYTGFSNPGNNTDICIWSAKNMNYCLRAICFNAKPRCKSNNFKHSYFFRKLAVYLRKIYNFIFTGLLFVSITFGLITHYLYMYHHC